MPTAIIFPGQGAQHVGMGQEVSLTYPIARECFEQASAAIGFDLAEICFGGPEQTLNRTDVAQPAILVTSVALMRARGSRPERAAFTAGLSLGEYTALVFAGALDFLDAVRLVRRRGELMQEASDLFPSTMVATRGLTRAEAETLCDRTRGQSVLSVANLNAPGQVVVSGDVDACDRLETLARDEKICGTVRLAVAGAFHSERMRPAARGLEAALAAVEIRVPQTPFYSNVTADRVSDPDEIRKLLAEQLTKPVLWQATMERALAQGIDDFEEIGPGRVLAGILKKIDRGASVRCINNAESIGEGSAR